MFRSKHARLPASLDELVPEFLPKLPDDPYAPDGKLRYVVLATPDKLGRRYLLYRVGGDGKDDAGAPHPKNAIEALQNKPGQPACDLILNGEH